MPVFTYKCPNCGGTLSYNADAKNWKCDYCLDIVYRKDIEDDSDSSGRYNPILEDLMEEAAEQREIKAFEPDSKARVYSCTNCGTDVITDDATRVDSCYYCHSTAISSGELSGIYKPSKLVPFKISRDAAIKAFNKWCTKKPFLLEDAISKAKNYKLTGIFVPLWMFDCKIIGEISAEATSDSPMVDEFNLSKETYIFDVSRTAIAQYRGIPANGSNRANDMLMKGLGAYDYTQMEDFSVSHLSGYMAVKYDMDYDEVFAPISEDIQQHSKKLLEDTIYGYKNVTVKNSSVDIKKKDIDYVLLPLWIFTYDYFSVKYMVAMNGQTGRITGSLPISGLKQVIWFCVLSALLFFILSVVGGRYW